MPMYLKRETIRLLEASIEAISIAITALGLPKRIELRENTSENAIEIGLVGVAAELAMSAIIVQVNGAKALRLPSGFYKTGTQIVDDFKSLMRNRLPKMAFLTQGVERPSEHIEEIVSSISKFKLLVKLRAGGLHSGTGPSRDVCVACLNDVLSFLNVLSRSSRIKPYTLNIPQKIEVIKSYELIIEELIQRMKTSTSIEDKSKALSAIYLILPELPLEEPEWLEAFERVAISPKEQDISFLLDTLGKSKYASLIKVSKSDVGLPVIIKPGDPNAIPIEPQFLKKTFLSIRDRWSADIGNANGRLEQGTYDVPPIESVYELFAFKLERLNITRTEDQQLTAHETWPFICSSLSYSGTLGPYWYFVRKTDDLGQLEAYINRAKKIGDAYLRNNHSELKSGIDAIRRNTPLPSKTKYTQELFESSEKAGEKKKNLLEVIKKHKKKPKALCEAACDDLKLVVDETNSLGDVLVKLVEGKYSFSVTAHKIYWTRILCEAATELEDSEGLLAVLMSQELSTAHTAARKALRVIDFLNYGPQVEI